MKVREHGHGLSHHTYLIGDSTMAYFSIHLTILLHPCPLNFIASTLQLVFTPPNPNCHYLDKYIMFLQIDQYFIS